MYDVYNETGGGDLGLWEKLGEESLYLEVGIYHIVMDAVVYVSAVSMVISGILLMIARKSSGGKLEEAKKGIIATFAISVAVFAVSSVVSLVEQMALR